MKTGIPEIDEQLEEYNKKKQEEIKVQEEPTPSKPVILEQPEEVTPNSKTDTVASSFSKDELLGIKPEPTFICSACGTDAYEVDERCSNCGEDFE